MATVPSLSVGLIGHAIDIAKLPLWNFLLVSVGHHFLQEKLGINPTPSFLAAASVGAIIYHGDNSAALRAIKTSYEALTALARDSRKQFAGVKTMDAYIHQLESDLWSSFKEYATLWKFVLASATLITAGLYFNPTHSKLK
ncbi:hypothetical protein [Candidatus Odyssella thessalonicensis]|uniref:hypothetical protein n=1 Tax=Candidatus Odyssella thessalonicensis TaxID=84647 RepID=UPI0002D2B97E|nr:hypothetical protein [Candidatus Odyssella thessalonicensis]